MAVEQIWQIDTSNIRYRTLSEQISDELEHIIIQKGDNLTRFPTERELSEKYGVSRSVIREALKLLQERGLIVMRAGDGTYTVRPGSTLISQTLRRVIQFNRYSDDNITEIRIALEVTAVRDAAKNATDKQIAELEAILDRMKQYKDNTDTEKRTQIDCEFHRYIAECSGNMLLAVLINSIMDMIKEYIRIRLEQNPQGNELGIIWHQKIVDAIKNHDVDTAGSYMRDHIDASFHQLDIDPA